MQTSTINFATRARSTSTNKPILVGFVNRYIKEDFIAVARNNKQLNADDIVFAGDKIRIFINDHLTQKNKKLFTKTKKLATDKNHKYVWVQNCKILVRKK